MSIPSRQSLGCLDSECTFHLLFRRIHKFLKRKKMVQDIMETWRLRTPNEWERFSTWSDVLIWRNQIYNIVINAFKGYAELQPQLYQLGYRDKAWNVNRCPFPSMCISEVSTHMYSHNFGFLCSSCSSHLALVQRASEEFIVMV